MRNALRRLPAWVKILLAVSIGLNLAVAGVVAGSALRESEARRIPFTVFGLRHVLRHLPEADRAPFDRAARTLSDEIGPIRERLREDRVRMAEIIRASEFDAEAMRALFAEQHGQMSRAATLSAERMVVTLDRLSPEARGRFADALLKPRTRRRPNGDDRKEHDPSD